MRGRPLRFALVVAIGLVLSVIAVVWVISNPNAPGRKLIPGLAITVWAVPLYIVVGVEVMRRRGRRGAADLRFFHGMGALTNAIGSFAPVHDSKGRPFKPPMTTARGWSGLNGILQTTEEGVCFWPTSKATRRGCLRIELHWHDVVAIRMSERKDFIGHRIVSIEIATASGSISVELAEPEGVPPKHLQNFISAAR